MKKIVVFGILLVVIYFTGGYYFHFLVKQHFAKQELYSNVAASVPFEGTLEFSIPLPFYGNVNKEYESKEGEFYYKNHYYNVLGSKIVDNTLIISCVANPKTKLLHEELFGFIQDNIISTSDSHSKSKNNKSFKLFLPEYASFLNRHYIYLYEWLSPINATTHVVFNFDNTLSINSPPPDFC